MILDERRRAWLERELDVHSASCRCQILQARYITDPHCSELKVDLVRRLLAPPQEAVEEEYEALSDQRHQDVAQMLRISKERDALRAEVDSGRKRCAVNTEPKATAREKPQSDADVVLAILLMSQGEWVPQLYTLSGCMVHSRVADLRKRGYQIECKRFGRKDWRYRLIEEAP